MSYHESIKTKCTTVMKAKCIKPGVVLSILLIPFLSFSNVEFNHQKDVVYGYKDGMALVMDIY